MLRDGEAIVGIRGRSKSGGACEERARVIIGADGMRSAFATAVGAEKVVERPPMTCCYYAFFSGLQATRVEMHVGTGQSGVVVPTNDGNALVGVQWPHGRFHEVRSDIERHHQKALEELSSELGERMRAARREERFVGTADLQNFFRRSHGPGWALVGDAAYHKDPITAQGISDSFRYAELLADAVDEGLSERRGLADALDEYERRRNESATPLFDWACRTAELRAPSGKTRDLIAALQSDPQGASLMMGLTAGTVLARDFFQADNIARILDSAAGRHRRPTGPPTD